MDWLEPQTSPQQTYVHSVMHVDSGVHSRMTLLLQMSSLINNSYLNFYLKLCHRM